MPNFSGVIFAVEAVCREIIAIIPLMRNEDIAAIFGRVADLLEIRGDNIHRVLSYRRASETLAELGRELRDLQEAGELTGIPGIGATLAAKIEELLQTGELEFYKRLTAEIPESLLELLRVDGLGPKRVKLIYESLHISTLAELAAAAREGKLRDLPGMGAKSEEKILKGIAALQAFGDGRYLLGEALPEAERILAVLRGLPQVTRTAVAGSLRRGRETIGDIDLLVATAGDSDTGPIMTAFTQLPQAASVPLHGPTKSRIVLANGLGVDLRVLPQENWGTLLSYFTGSQAHNVRLRELAQKQGLSLNEYAFTNGATGEKILCPDEESVYRTLNLPYIVPPLREDRGEIEAAQRGELPSLIELQDVRYDLHMHSTWSDGRQTILEMARAARKRGLRGIAITDHSASLGVANGLTADRLQAQAEEIAAAREVMGDDFFILHGTEMEIRADGSLDFEDEVLAGLDWVIASLHVGLGQPRKQITERLLNAIRHPLVHMIAHPTGRLLGRRPAADLDMEAVFAAAVENGIVLEINANPQRLDLNDGYVRRALEFGVKLAINTDAHDLDQLALLSYGITTAQRGWATAGDVVNTWPVETFLSFIRSRPDAA